MDFLFFSAADVPLFVRNDAESATWTVEELGLQALFPWRDDKVIRQGMRIGFKDDTGVFQPFEIRKVRTYEPDHYQEITAEHIAISELSDEHIAPAELTNVTAQAALTQILTGTLWSVGQVTASGTSSGDVSMGSVWQAARVVEENWNVYITPRVTFGAGGITGRYLDIAPAEPVWRGVRLSLDKNADEIGVTWDDTETYTALYGYGRSVDRTPINFGSVTWTQTSDHPAKPAGQTYLEDPAATALYGRNGRPRFGFYQNGDITDPGVLLQKTWDALKLCNAPQVSIDCQVRDLYRLGYADQPIRLHDAAIIDVQPTGEMLRREIIRLTVDLLDPTATRPTIGAYIPNIIYIQRETATRASGRGGGGGRGGRGGGGQTNAEYQLSEYETEITANNYQIGLRAYQRDMDNVENILRQAGMSINAQGVLIYADDAPNMVGSKFNVQADRITTEVTDRTNADSTLSSRITQTASEITLKADKVTVDALSTYINNLVTGVTQASYIRAAAATINSLNLSGLLFNGNTVSWKSQTVVTGLSGRNASVTLSVQRRFLSGVGTTVTGGVTGYLVTGRTNGTLSANTTTIYYLGR